MYLGSEAYQGRLITLARDDILGLSSRQWPALRNEVKRGGIAIDQSSSLITVPIPNQQPDHSTSGLLTQLNESSSPAATSSTVSLD